MHNILVIIILFFISNCIYATEADDFNKENINFFNTKFIDINEEKIESTNITNNNSANATDLVKKFSGSIDVYSGITSQKHNVSPNHNKFAINGSATIRALIANEQNEEFKYGAKLVIKTTAINNGNTGPNGSHIYLDSEFGKIEIGSPFSVSKTMAITSGKISASSCTGGWSSGGDNLVKLADPFQTTYTTSYIESKLAAADGVEATRKISYYTPEFSGLKFGISYVPDTTNKGSGDLNQKATVTKVKYNNKEYETILAAKDAVAIAVNYTANLSDDVKLQAGATTEIAKLVNNYKFQNPTTSKEEIAKLPKEAKLRNLRFYSIGSVLTYGNFSYSASYATLGKSLVSKAEVGAKATKYYGIGTAYTQGPIGVSVNYFHSINQYSNKFDSFVIATDYKVLPGLVPYAEIAYFISKAKGAEKKKTGVVGILGMALSFN